MNDTYQPAAIEISIDIGDDEQQAVVEDLIASLNIEQLVDYTLRSVQVTQGVTLAVLITDDETIQELNRQYRHIDKPTDVLSFPLLDAPLVDAPPEQLWMTPEGNEAHGVSPFGDAPPFIVPDELPTSLGDIVISWPTVERQARGAGHSTSYELLFLLAHGVLHLVGYDDQSEAGYQEMMRLQNEALRAAGQTA